MIMSNFGNFCAIFLSDTLRLEGTPHPPANPLRPKQGEAAFW